MKSGLVKKKIIINEPLAYTAVEKSHKTKEWVENNIILVKSLIETCNGAENYRKRTRILGR